MATLLTVKLDGDMPSPLVFYTANQLPAHAVWPLHTHDAGEFVYSFSGVMEIQAGEARLQIGRASCRERVSSPV